MLSQTKKTGSDRKKTDGLEKRQLTNAQFKKHKKHGHALKDMDNHTNRDTCTNTRMNTTIEVALRRVSSTPVPLLPFLPTGKVILSTPSETNAYITKEP